MAAPPCCSFPAPAQPDVIPFVLVQRQSIGRNCWGLTETLLPAKTQGRTLDCLFHFPPPLLLQGGFQCVVAKCATGLQWLRQPRVLARWRFELASGSLSWPSCVSAVAFERERCSHHSCRVLMKCVRESFSCLFKTSQHYSSCTRRSFSRGSRISTRLDGQLLWFYSIGRDNGFVRVGARPWYSLAILESTAGGTSWMVGSR